MLLLDQAAKLLVHARLQLYETITVIPGHLNLYYVRNSGLIWSLFSRQLAGYSTWIYLVINLIALLIILRIFFQTENRAVLLPLGLSLVLAGALGNLLDRLRWGYVVDFIQMYYRSGAPSHRLHSWAIYNVADIAITCGIILLIMDSLRPARRAN